MYCKSCGETMNDNQAICLKCGVKAGKGDSFCANCGSPMNAGAAVCLNCGVAAKGSGSSDGKLTKSKEGKIIAGVYSGLGKKLGISPWIFRIAHILLLFVGIGFLLLIAYIIAAIAMPSED